MHPLRHLLLGLVMVSLLAACTAPVGSPSPSAAASVEPSAAASATAGKVSANTATLDELTAAFEAAGVPNPGQWAEEVIGHRPIPADDTQLNQLRQNLLIHDPDPATLSAILGALTP